MPIWWPRPREPQWIVTTTSPCPQPEGRCDGRVVDVGYLLHLEVVVARAERAHLVPLPLLGLGGDELGTRFRHAAVLLDALEVRRLAVALLEAPSARRPRSIASSSRSVRWILPVLPTPGRDGAGQLIGERSLTALDVGPLQAAQQVRTPQEMSKPTPPAETMPPWSGSNAATPPIGKP